MGTKVQEIKANPNGDRSACPTCVPKPGRVRLDQLWVWSLANPGKPVLR